MQAHLLHALRERMGEEIAVLLFEEELGVPFPVRPSLTAERLEPVLLGKNAYSTRQIEL